MMTAANKDAKGATPSAHFVYIIEAEDGRYYTGYTTDVARRLREHRDGKGAKFTRAFGATRLLYQEKFATKSEALRREAEVKKLSRDEKVELISERPKTE